MRAVPCGLKPPLACCSTRLGLCCTVTISGASFEPVHELGEPDGSMAMGREISLRPQSPGSPTFPGSPGSPCLPAQPALSPGSPGSAASPGSPWVPWLLRLPRVQWLPQLPQLNLIGGLAMTTRPPTRLQLGRQCGMQPWASRTRSAAGLRCVHSPPGGPCFQPGPRGMGGPHFHRGLHRGDCAPG